MKSRLQLELICINSLHFKNWTGMRQLTLQVVNRDLPQLKNFVFCGAHVKMILCADTKALWAMLGMGSNGTFPCPLCEVHKDLMQVPRSQRALCKPRTFAGIMQNFDANMRYL